MNEPTDLPEMREFVMSLLLVAAGEGRSRAKTLDIVNNAALRYCIELAGQLSELLRRATREDASFDGWLARDVRPVGFFEFCGLLLDAVDRRLRGRHPQLAPNPDDAASSYDHAAFLALGQTLCHAAGVRGGQFPSLAEGWRRASTFTPRQMQQGLIANYLGNVLQDYFEATQVRAEFPQLPTDTEHTLRHEEAAGLAEWLFTSARATTGALDVPTVQQHFRDLMGRVWAADKALDD